MLEPKQHFIEKLLESGIITGTTTILELGSGQSRAILAALEKFPDLVYVGVEPSPKDAAVAKDLLKNYKNAKIINALAYDGIEGYGPFDMCISLSVLEHVKQLDKFLINSVQSTKSGGHIIHRYDLGHALYPDSLKERFQIFLGNNFPNILPEHKFVRYLDEKEVIDILEKNGAVLEKMTYHQMPNHKSFVRHFQASSPERVKAAEEIFDWEYRVSPFLSDMEKKHRELLFPTITVWAKKK